MEKEASECVFLIPSGIMVQLMHQDTNLEACQSCWHTVIQIQEAGADHGSDVSVGA